MNSISKIALKSLIINLIIFFVSVLVSLYVSELLIFTVLKNPIEKRYLIAKEQRLDLPVFSPWELWQKENPFIGELNIFPTGGISSQSVVYCNESDGWLKYTSDRFGFNNDPKYVEEIVNSTIALDIMLVGDSFVHGACVPVGSNFQGSFIKMGKSSLGIGYGGNGPMMSLISIKEYAHLLRPKEILFMYYEGNDLPQIRAEVSSPISLYLNKGHYLNLSKKQALIDERLRIEINRNYEELDKKYFSYSYNMKSILTFHFSTLLLKRIFSNAELSCEWDYSDYEKSGELEALVSTVLESHRYSKSINANYHFVYLKSANSVLKKCNYAKGKIISALKRGGVSVIDTSGVIGSGEGWQDYFSLGRRGGHYSQKGYFSIAKYLNSVLIEKN